MKSNSSIPWLTDYNTFNLFLEEHKRFPRNLGKTQAERHLHRWRVKQIQLDRKGALDPHQKNLLDKIGALKDLRIDQWSTRFEQTVVFLKKHNRLPSKHRPSTTLEKQLANWRHNNNKLLREGLLLDAEKKMLFINAGLADERFDAYWEKMFEASAKFINTYGLPPSRHSHQPGESKLARWREHAHRKIKDGVYSPEQAEQFFNLGLGNNILDKKWHATLKKVVQFKKKHNRLPCPFGGEPGEYSLGNWCNSQNSLYRRKKLPKTRQQLLLAAGILNTK
jgi:hypothetical protein